MTANRYDNAGDTTGRALIAPPQFIAPAAGLLLLLTAGLKVYQYLHSPIVPSGLQSLPDFEATLIGLEFFLGLWLLSGALPMAARRVATGCFSVFACYTLYEAVSGRASCGCFGQVRVNPWYTFVLDSAIICAMTFFGRPDEKQTKPSRWSQRKWPVAAALGIGLAAGIGSVVLHPNPIVAANGLASADGGKLVILEPYKWLGHRLPVLKDIVAQRGGRALGNQIAAGQWIVMFYHASCEVCRQTIPVYEALARREAMSGKTPHIAFIRVPSDPPSPASPGLFDSRLALHGTLDSGHEWFAATPIVVELRNGIVVRVVTGAAAMNLNWRRTAGAGLNETARLLSGP